MGVLALVDIFNEIYEVIQDAETVAKAFNIQPFDIYFLGGSACILGKYTIRATKDIDFIDIGYSANLGKVFAMFKDYDMLEYESTLLSPKFKERAIKINDFEYLNVYVLSKEDIIVSKIIRLEQKDIEDIDAMIESSDKRLILKIIDEVISRNDLFDSKRQGFIANVSKFKELYNV